MSCRGEALTTHHLLKKFEGVFIYGAMSNAAFTESKT